MAACIPYIPFDLAKGAVAAYLGPRGMGITIWESTAVTATKRAARVNSRVVIFFIAGRSFRQQKTIFLLP